MVDKIIKGSDNQDNLFDNIIKLNSARLLFLFYYYNRDYKTDVIVDKLIELDNPKYLHFLIRVVQDKYYDILLNKLIEYDDAKLLYYVSYDTFNLSVDKLKLIANKLIELNDIYYIILFYNLFFFVRKYTDSELYNNLSYFFNKNNIDIKDINEKSLNTYIEKKLNLNIDDKNYFSNNCYRGRKYIPDMIVCHICNNYKKAIDMFYDEKTEVSAHFVISKEGEVKQVISLDDSAWANGTSIRDSSDIYYNFSNIKNIRDRKTNANYYSFSIEHESFDGSLTEVQYQASLKTIIKIIKYMKEKYNHDFIIDREHLIGHNDVNPIVRTSCPGVNFPFDRLINDLKKEKF